MKVNLPDPKDLALAAGEAQAATLRERLEAGTNAEGDAHSITKATLERRKRNPDSLGLDTPLVDTGQLVKGIAATIQRKGKMKGLVKVDTGRDRRKALRILENKGWMILSVDEETMSKTVWQALDGSIK